ncbi:MAG: autotransporter outer membrane beta-barrel domain-containing protein, partial [Geminicoccaceae bacterium]|nr:autotransporter outer membrane beta-barrel domain-containing protein [Geminicoccaceae bacterium]
AAGASAQARLQQDIAGGLVVAPPTTTTGAALTPIAFGDPEAPASAADLDPSRAGFAGTRATRNGGAGLDYEMGDGLSLGLAAGRYADRIENDRLLAGTGTDLATDAFAVYLRQRTFGLELETRFSSLETDYTRRDFDAISDSRGRTRFGGSAQGVSQRVAAPLDAGGVTFCPWAELGYSAQSLDAYTMQDPYLGAVRVDGGGTSEFKAGVGLNLAALPLDLGRGRSLALGADVSLERTLGRQDLTFEVRDSAGSQREVLPRGEATTATLGLGGTLRLGDAVDLKAGFGLAGSSEGGGDGSVNLGASWRF